MDIGGELKQLSDNILKKCTFGIKSQYFGDNVETDVLLPSGDMKYQSLWVRDCVMMSEYIDDCGELLKYIKIFSEYGQNGAETVILKNGLCIPPFAVADHINYNAKPVFFPGTLNDGEAQGEGKYGFYPPLDDNYYYIFLVYDYIKKSKNKSILNELFKGHTLLERIKNAFCAYNICEKTGLCMSDGEKYTVDWGFCDSIVKTGYLVYPSILRYKAAIMLYELTCDKAYEKAAEKIKAAVKDCFYDSDSGWLMSSAKIGKQPDVWATAYCISEGLFCTDKMLLALKNGFENKTAVKNGYVRHIPTDCDFDKEKCWEIARTKKDYYQNGGYWATSIGWYAYALSKLDLSLALRLFEDFLLHTEKYAENGAPFEWINADTTDFSGKYYGTSGVLPYIYYKKIFG